MKFRQRARYLALAPWFVVRWLKVWRAWEREDWQRMISLLQDMVGSGLDTNGERILLGVAFAREGQLTDALAYFGRVTRQYLLKAEEPVFFNEYASALYRAGRAADGADLLRNAPLDRFPEPQRRWATDFVKSFGRIDWPPLQGLKPPRVLH